MFSEWEPATLHAKFPIPKNPLYTNGCGIVIEKYNSLENWRNLKLSVGLTWVLITIRRWKKTHTNSIWMANKWTSVCCAIVYYFLLLPPFLFCFVATNLNESLSHIYLVFAGKINKYIFCSSMWIATKFINKTCAD